jgi:hypothetical protein
MSALLLAVVALTASAPASGADLAEDLIKKALELRRRGDDLGAFPLLERARQISPTPRAAAQLGFCAQAIGRWADAEVHLSEALKATNDPWVKKNRVPIEESLAAAKAHVAVIEISGDPAGGEVLVNGNPVGTLPLDAPVRVAAGEIDLELRARGHQRTTRSLRVEGGQYQKIVLRAQPDTAAAAPAVRPPAAIAPPPQVTAAATTPDPTTAPPQVTVTAQPESPVSGWRRAAKWVSWSLGAAALGVGVYGTLRNGSLIDDFDAGCAIDPQIGPYAVAGSGRTNAGCASLKSDYESASTMAVIGFVGAGALVATGFVLLLTEPAGESRTAWSCVPGLAPHNAISVGCSLRF